MGQEALSGGDAGAMPLAVQPAVSYQTQPARYDIEYGTGIHLRNGEYVARSFQSRGTIEFGSTGIRILVLKTGLLQLDTSIDLNIPFDWIFNVTVSGRTIRFDAQTGIGDMQMIRLQVQNRPLAREIAARLPSAQTAEFAEAAAKLERFNDAVETRMRHPWVTWLLVALNVAVFAVMIGSGANLVHVSTSSALPFGSNFGPSTLDGEWWRLLTSTFVHFGLLHLTFNMIVLFYMGRHIERIFGHGRFAALYLFSGVSASLVSLCWHPDLNSAGASGAIFGVLGALVAYAVRHRASIPGMFVAQRVRSAIAIVAYTLWAGINHRGVDNAGHIGGLLAGLLMGWLLAQQVDAVETAESRAELRDVLYLATGVAAFAFAALVFQAVRMNATPQAQQELAFAAMLQTESHDDTLARHDLAQLQRRLAPGKSLPPNFAVSIRTTIWPEWDRLYQRLAATPLPPGSPHTAFRTALLLSYDDTRRALQKMADGAAAPERTTPADLVAMRTLMDDAKHQRDLALKLYGG